MSLGSIVWPVNDNMSVPDMVQTLSEVSEAELCLSSWDDGHTVGLEPVLEFSNMSGYSDSCVFAKANLIICLERLRVELSEYEEESEIDASVINTSFFNEYRRLKHLVLVKRLLQVAKIWRSEVLPLPPKDIALVYAAREN